MSNTTRNKSTTDFPSGSGSGGGVAYTIGDRSDARIQVDLETATDTHQGGSFDFSKRGKEVRDLLCFVIFSPQVDSNSFLVYFFSENGLVQVPPSFCFLFF